ncbi:MAG: hypothetical protein ACHQ6U_12420 [Thermodesulfobacteriota bacterium]
MSAQFTEKELVDLTFVIADMNFWNSIAIGFRKLPGARDEVRKKRAAGEYAVQVEERYCEDRASHKNAA